MNRFHELDIVRVCELKLNNEFKLPFRFEIGNIKTEEAEEIVSVDFYAQDYNLNKRFRSLKDMFSDLDLNMIEFNKESWEDFNEEFNMQVNDNGNYIFTEIKDFIKFLLKYYINDSRKFDLIKNFVNNNRTEIFNMFKDRIVTLLGLGVKEETKTNEFMDLRILETSAHPFFRENIGRAIQDYSLREVFLRKAYFSRKYELDLKKQQRELEHLKKSRQNLTNL